MDKYSKPLIRVLLLPTVFLLIGLLGTPASAQQDTWSFEQHPHPYSTELSDAETKLIDDTYEIETIIELCENVVTVNFQIYLNRYPDYLKNDQPQEKFHNWQIHFVTPEQRGAIPCFYFQAAIELVPYSEQPLATDFTYCGTYSRKPTNQREREFVKSFDAFMALVKANPFSGATQILGQNSINSYMRLNSDVEYFFSLLLEPFVESDETISDIINLTPNLNADRMIFVRQAAQDLDLQAVLDTTRPCVLGN